MLAPPTPTTSAPGSRLAILLININQQAAVVQLTLPSNAVGPRLEYHFGQADQGQIMINNEGAHTVTHTHARMRAHAHAHTHAHAHKHKHETLATHTMVTQTHTYAHMRQLTTPNPHSHYHNHHNHHYHTAPYLQCHASAMV
jgi:hypothetical protein